MASSSNTQADPAAALTNIRSSSRTARSASEIIISTNSPPASSMQTRSSSTMALIPLPPAKRQRLSDVPRATTTSTTPPIPSTPVIVAVSSARKARDVFFDSLIVDKPNSNIGPSGRSISSADDLDKPELMRCFYLLHACGRATQSDATLETTRKSIEGFLDAIFNEWFAKGDDEVECAISKPTLDMQFEAEVQAGAICEKFNEHKSWIKCNDSKDCKANITAKATYASDPPGLKLGFLKRDTPNGESCVAAPLHQANARWREQKEWMTELRDILERKAVAQVHKYNKHLAIWKARMMIRAWAKNEDYKEGCSGDWGFITGKDARLALMIVGVGE